MLKKCGNLGKNWDSTSLKSVVNFSTRPDKVEKLIQHIVNDKEDRNVVRIIYWREILSIIYDVWKSADVNNDFSNLRHIVNDFYLGMIVAVEFQILSCNFKAFKKVDNIKTYSFRLLEIYLVNDLMQSIMFILNKCQRRNNKWMVRPSCTRKTKTRMNLLKS